MEVFPKYEKVKSSNSPWLGQVPKHWNVLPGLAVVKENKEKNKGMIESTVLSLSYGKVVIKPPEKLTGLVPESFETYQVINPGDIIIRPTDLQNDTTSLRTGLAKDRGIITSAYLCLRPVGSANPKYLHYLLHAYDLMKVFYGLGSGLRQNLDYRDFKRLEFALPTVEEQERIINFLNLKTSEIDATIAKKQRLIELLKEQKAILINQAVTKGLNPSAPMRDSGMQWIGKIPEHWNIYPLTKYLESIVDYRGKTPAKVDSGVFLVTAKNIEEGEIDYECSKEYVAENQYEKIMSRGKPKAGDVLFTTEAPLGAVAIVDREDIALAQRIIKFRLKRRYLLPEFAKHAIMSPYFQNHLISEATGSTAQGIKASKLHKFKLVAPSPEEQRSILSEIDQRSKFIEESILSISKEIGLIAEMKNIYISSAVTGKIKI